MKTPFCENQGTAHAVLSPSSAHRWIKCAAAPMMERGYPDDAGEYAREGTAAHEAAALALLTGKPAQAREHLPAELVPYVQEYVDLVNRMAQGKRLYIEKRLALGSATGEQGAYGTADAVIVDDKEIIVVDLKFGRGVKVDATDNPQLLLYGYAARVEFCAGVKSLRLVIFQPRLHHLSEHRPTGNEIGAFIRASFGAGKIALALHDGKIKPTEAYFAPSESACRFCRARSGCAALANLVHEAVGADFEALAEIAGDNAAVFEYLKNSGADIARAYAELPVIESWCRAVAAEAERILHAGEDLPGFKLVAGRKGARFWRDSDGAANALRALQFGDADIYERKLITPAQAEKLFRASGMAADFWKPLDALISQNDAKPVIVPAGDKRPALSTAVKDDFTELA